MRPDVGVLLKKPFHNRPYAHQVAFHSPENRSTSVKQRLQFRFQDDHAKFPVQRPDVGILFKKFSNNRPYVHQARFTIQNSSHQRQTKTAILVLMEDDPASG
jgi:hypothetical protein